MNAYDSIRQGLTEAIDFAQGKQSGEVVHEVEVPEVDVAAIRASTASPKPPSRAASVLQRAPCSTGNTAAAARPAPHKCCWR